MTHIECIEGSAFVQPVPLPGQGFDTVTMTVIDMDDGNACAFAGWDAKDVLADVTPDAAPATGSTLNWQVTTDLTTARHLPLFYERRRAVVQWTRGAEVGVVDIGMTIWSQVGVPGPNTICPDPAAPPGPIIG